MLVADVAGIAAAYYGFRASLKGKKPQRRTAFPAISSFSSPTDKAGRSKDRPAALREHLMTDTHSPAEYRADAVRNMGSSYSRPM